MMDVVVERPQAPSENRLGRGADPHPAGPRPEPLAVVAAGATLGAGLIHLAYALPHLDVSVRDGTFFLVVGWLQLAAAVGLAFRAPPPRVWLAGAALLNAAVIGVWLVSRTVGVPGSHDEGFGFPDGAASGLEAVAVAAAIAGLAGWGARAAARRAHPVALAVPGVALVALVTASVTPALAGDHATGGHATGGHAAGGHAAGGHAAGGHAAGGHGAGGHGHAAGDDAENAARVAALKGHLPEREVERYEAYYYEYLTEQIMTRSPTIADLPEAERERRLDRYVRWAIDNALVSEQVHGSGPDGEHHVGPEEWQPLTDPADIVALQAELRAAGEAMAEVPTAADAMEAGYHQATPYVPGVAAHYINPDYVRDGFDPAKPEMLLYNGHEPRSELVGFSYVTWGDEPAEGFVGPNDSWHRHPSLCVLDGIFVIGPDHTPESMCASIGGEKGVGGELWMTHLWQVPGWESPWGLFSGENPTLNLATLDAPV